MFFKKNKKRYRNIKKNEKKYRKAIKDYLGIDKSTAMSRLKKIIMFELAKKAGMDRCFRCKSLISDVAEFSVEHIKPWLWSDVKLFWDINNIAFSHLLCNVAASKVKKKCGSYSKYLRGCRCSICRTEYLKCAKVQQRRRYKRIVAVKKLANLSTNKEVTSYWKKMKKKYEFTEMKQLITKLKKEKR